MRAGLVGEGLGPVSSVREFRTRSSACSEVSYRSCVRYLGEVRPKIHTTAGRSSGVVRAEEYCCAMAVEVEAQKHRIGCHAMTGRRGVTERWIDAPTDCRTNPTPHL